MSTDEGSTSEQEPAQNGTGSQQPQPGDQQQHQPQQQHPPQPQQQQQHPGQLAQPQPHPGFPPHYPPHFMQPGRGYPGYPPPPHGFPPPHPGQPYPYPPHMMRPPGVPPSAADLVRLPPGPNPLEWSAQQKKMAENNPGTPASIPAPSPAASSVAEDSMDDKSRLDSPSWPNQGQRTPVMHPGAPPPMMGHPGMMPGVPPQSMMPRKESIVEKLVGPPSAANPPRVMPERRAFFERLVAFCEQQNDPITMIPQVSKQNVDLHRLYIAVRNKGGFEQVTKEKMWKSICAEANPEISESSAAGYQLRKHYQRHLLLLECMETGKNPDDAVAFADKLKRQRRKDGQTPNPGTPSQPAVPSTSGFPPGHGPPQPQQPGAPDPSQYPPQQQPPYGPPYGFPGHPGYPPGVFPPRIPPGVTPMRAPQPQQHMPGAEEGQQQQNTLQVPGQMCQPATPGGQAGPGSVQPTTPQMQQVDSANSQAGSRAPSVGPNVSAATPDSSSRLSGGGDGSEQPRPESAAAPTPRSIATPTPGPTPGPPQMPPGHPMHMPPSTSMAAQVQPGQPGGPPVAPNYYGQPAPMYPNGTPRPGPPGYPPGYPAGYPMPGGPGMPGVPPQHFPPGSHPAAHPSHPHHQQYLIWHQSRGYPPQQPGQGPPRQMPPQPYGYPPRIQPPPQAQMNQGAPSPGGTKMRYPPQPHPQQQQPQQFPTQQQPRPMPPQQPQYAPPTPQQPQQQQAPPTTSTIPFAHGQSFPKTTIEGTVISQTRRKRPMARDLCSATPRRLVMALRSGLETEAVWAMNALNVLLYDDTNPHPTLNQMPGLLNVLVEHFWATLSLLYPERFALSGTYSRKTDFSNADEAAQLTKSEERMDVKTVVTARSAEKKTDYTNFSRTGRKVQLKEVEMPETLKRQLMGEQGTSYDETVTCEYVEKRATIGLGGGLAERVAERLRSEWECSKATKKPVFSRHEGVSIWEDQETPETSETNVKEEPMDEENEVPDILIHRKPKPEELSEGPNDFEMRWPVGTALTDRDEVLYRLAMRALSLSNIIRGFSFLPGNESQLGKHHGLIYLLGRFLRLCAEEQPLKRTNPQPKQDLEAPLPAPEPFHVARKKAVSLLDSDDANRLLLVETANQLRDDAFVILCHLSASIDLYDMPSELAFPIYDGILGWCVSSVPEAVDPLPPAATSLRNYCLEIVCKMSVLEKNMDMILSTGAWPRLEKLVKLLAKMLSMGEETHNREFAIVILNALCTASEPICYVAALDSPAIQNLIGFIESSDQNMHQVMTTHGMPTLRDNPELMGTSVGMLRRAACMLKLLVKVPEAHKVFLKHQQRLLQFTMSQLMDSRVAGMIADTLFEIQTAALSKIDIKSEDSRVKPKTSEEVVKTEVDDVSSVPSEESSSCENTLSSAGTVEKKCNGNSNPKKASKRPNSGDASPPSTKRSCLENGFPEKKNGKIEKTSLQLKESRTENNSSMAVVA